MSDQYTLLGISGALRKNSTNRQLVAEAARIFGPTTLVIADLNLPLYDGDAEHKDGIPASVHLLANQISAADAVIISTPEYNSALSGVLKNALDWVSRTEGSPWSGKPVAIMAAAAGRSGGARALSSLRLCLAPFRPNIIPGPEVLIASSGNAFDVEGTLIDDRSRNNVSELMASLRTELK